MEDLQLALTTSRTDQRNFGLWINNWQIGQSLNALVTNTLPSGSLVLRVGGQQLTATSDIPIQQGAQLHLEVKQLKPVPLLKILNAAQATAATGPQNATLRLLPALSSGLASTPVAGVLQAAQTLQAAPGLPSVLVASVGELLRLASRPERLAGSDGLARAVGNSGVFLESRLASDEAPRRGAFGQDLKASILRSLARTDAALGQVEATALGGADAQALMELKRELEGGLGRIQANQIASQPAEGQPRAWQFEIPVHWGDGFHTLSLRIDEPDPEDSRGADAGEDRPWSVHMELDAPPLGNLSLDLKVDERRVRAEFAAARPGTRRLLDVSQPLLVNALASRGLRLEAGPARVLDPVKTRDEALPAAGLDLRA